jgi:hypothetical protein
MESEFNEQQIEFLKSLDYLSSGEIKDLILGFTNLEVLLDSEDLEEFNQL